MSSVRLQLQRTLFSEPELAFDAAFPALPRIHLDDAAWIDVGPGWVADGDALFEEVLRLKPWR